MKKLIFAFTLSMIVMPYYSVAEPQIIKKQQNISLKIPTKMQNILDQYHKFEPFTASNYHADIHKIFQKKNNQAPMANVLDLNKDGKKDLVVMGSILLKGQSYIEVVALVSSNSKFVLSPIKRWKLPVLDMRYENGHVTGQWLYYLLTANDYEHKYNRIPASSTAFKIEAYQSSTLLYYLDRGKFKLIRH